MQSILSVAVWPTELSTKRSEVEIKGLHIPAIRIFVSKVLSSPVPHSNIDSVGRGGALVESMTFNRRVVGSTPALAAT